MKKWISYGIQIILAYFTAIFLLLIMIKTGLIKVNMSIWVIAAGGVLGSLIGAGIWKIYKIIRKLIMKEPEDVIRDEKDRNWWNR